MPAGDPAGEAVAPALGFACGSQSAGVPAALGPAVGGDGVVAPLLFQIEANAPTPKVGTDCAPCPNIDFSVTRCVGVAIVSDY